MELRQVPKEVTRQECNPVPREVCADVTKRGKSAELKHLGQKKISLPGRRIRLITLIAFLQNIFFFHRVSHGEPPGSEGKV